MRAFIYLCVSLLIHTPARGHTYVKNKAGLTGQAVPGRRIPGHRPSPGPEALAVAEPVTPGWTSWTFPCIFIVFLPPRPPDERCPKSACASTFVAARWRQLQDRRGRGRCGMGGRGQDGDPTSCTGGGEGGGRGGDTVGCHALDGFPKGRIWLATSKS